MTWNLLSVTPTSNLSASPVGSTVTPCPLPVTSLAPAWPGRRHLSAEQVRSSARWPSHCTVPSLTSLRSLHTHRLLDEVLLAPHVTLCLSPSSTGLLGLLFYLLLSGLLRLGGAPREEETAPCGAAAPASRATSPPPCPACVWPATEPATEPADGLCGGSPRKGRGCPGAGPGGPAFPGSSPCELLKLIYDGPAQARGFRA